MAQKDHAGIRKAEPVGYLRRDFLFAALVVPIVGCGRNDTNNGKAGEANAEVPEPRQMGLEELRTALREGFGNEKRFTSSDFRGIPARADFLGRPRNVLWVEHIEGEYLSFVGADGIEVRRNSWLEEIEACSCSVALIVPGGAYSDAGGFLKMLQNQPKWYLEDTLKSYACTRLTFEGFYLTYNGKRDGANVLSNVSVASYDSSLPEGRLKGYDIIIDCKGTNVSSDVSVTHRVKEVLAEVRAEYTFGQLERYYEQGLAVFAKGKEDSVES